MKILGIIFMFVAGMGLLFLFLKKRRIEEKQKNLKERAITPSVLPSDLEEKPEKKLGVAKSGQSVSLLGEGERQILASVNLHEMTQISKGAPWAKTGAMSKVLVLAGNVFIFKMPSLEGGKSVWLKANQIETFPLTSFYIGTEESPGPARIFRQKKQSVAVDYNLPNDLMLGMNWQVVDIGTLDVDVDGESENFQNGDRLYFVTSNEKGGQQRLLYLDARKGEAKGTGGLFLCESFEPTVDIREIL